MDAVKFFIVQEIIKSEHGSAEKKKEKSRMTRMDEFHEFEPEIYPQMNTDGRRFPQILLCACGWIL